MKIKTGNGSISPITLIAIWSVSAVVSLPGLAVSPILGKLSVIFPKAGDLEIQMLTSLPSLLIIPFVLLSGKLSIGRDKIRLLILGLSLFFGSGILYFFATSMTALIAISCILGIGAGIMIPLSTGLIVDYFRGAYRVKQLGLSSAINNITLVLATALAGYLANFNWHAPFIVYTFPGISLALAFFLKKERPAQKPHTFPSEKATVKEKQTGIDRRKLIQLMGLYFFVTYAVLAVAFYLPFLAQKHHMGSSLSGTMISLFFLAIMAPGFFLNKIIMRFKGKVNFISMICIVTGLSLIGFFPDKFFMITGCLLSGFGYGVMQPLIYDKTAAISTRKMSTLALSFVMSVNYLAIMVCPFIIDTLQHLFGTQSNRFPFLVNAILMLALTIWTYFKQNSFTLGVTPAYYKGIAEA